MSVIAKLPDGPLKDKLMHMWKENDRLNRVGGNVSTVDRLVKKEKKEKLVMEANKLLADYKSGVVRDVRSGLMDSTADNKLVNLLESAVKLVHGQSQVKRKWAADLSVVDPEATDTRPSSAGGSSSATALQPPVKTVWAVQSEKKQKVPKGDVPDELTSILNSLHFGAEVTLHLKRSSDPVTAVYRGMTEGGMMEVDVQSSGRNPKSKKVTIQNCNCH